MLKKFAWYTKPNFVDLIKLDKYLFEKMPGDVVFCFDNNANIIEYRLDSVDSGNFFVGKETI